MKKQIRTTMSPTMISHLIQDLIPIIIGDKVYNAVGSKEWLDGSHILYLHRNVVYHPLDVQLLCPEYIHLQKTNH